MLIEYATHHSWFKNSKLDCLEHYGKNDGKKIRKTLVKQQTLGVTTTIEPVSESFFEWFLPMYTKRISEKENALVLDVKGTTVDKPGVKFPYYGLTVYENGVPKGGCIFSDRGSWYSIAYRVFDHNWTNSEIAAKPALFGEYILDEHTKTYKKTNLTHGLDRNPYGINSSIGLCIFKLSVGCTAKLRSPDYTIATLETDDIKTDALILHAPTDTKIISTATLITHSHTAEKYQQVFKYPDVLKVDTILID